MKKALKIVFGTVAALLLLVVTAVTLLIVFFPTEKVRQIAQEQLSIRLRRQVVISKLSINILKGIVVSGIRVSERPTFREGTFVEIKTVYCRYNLLEMLKAVLAARDPEALKKQTLRFAFVIDSPSVNLRRFVDPRTGKAVFNFSDLLPQPKAKAEEPKRPAPKRKPAKPAEPPKEVIPEVKAPPLPFNLEVVELGVKNGRIELVDTATPRFREVYTLKDVRFLVSGINLRRNSPMRLNTGFGLAIKEYKDGAETDVDVHFALDITGRFTLFDDRRVLNPTGDLFLTLADGKLTGVQIYRELAKEGRALTAKAEEFRKRYVASYEQVRRSLEQARQGGPAARYLGALPTDLGKVQALADKVAAVDMGFIAKAMDLPFLAETLTFDRLTARVHIRDQRAVSSNFEMKGQHLSARGRGWVGFNTTLDWDITLLADRRYNNNFLTAALATPEGDIALPVRITGTVARPVVRFDVDLMPALDAELRKRFGPEVADLVTGKVTVAALLRQATDTAREMVQQKIDEARQQVQERVDEAKRRAEAEAEAARKRAEAEAEAARKRAEAEAEAARQEAQRRAEEEKRRQEEAARQEAERKAQEALRKSGVKVPGF